VRKSQRGPENPSQDYSLGEWVIADSPLILRHYLFFNMSNYVG
jgi:hypothetical protein